MNKSDKKIITDIIGDMIKEEHVQQMKEYIQHGNITTYKHCINVVKLCYILDKKFDLNADPYVLLNGALLHDFYLYDWHKEGLKHGLHGYTHPDTAADKAIEIFDVDEKTESIIRSHMWPLTLFHPPKSKEGWILCVADKLSSMAETLWMRK
ncbi:MAG: HD domain-containing protein [Eubacterium sp.]|nr:HD domain-containing protein [Eubacterium sp.]